MSATADVLRSVAIGSLILTGFGALWLVLGISSLWGLHWRLLLGVVLIAAVLVAGALRTWSAAHYISIEAPGSRETVIRSDFGAVTTLEFGLIFLTVLVCRLIRRRDLILPLIALIVGLHFIPLATIFAARVYNYTGSAIVLAAIVSFLAPTEVLRRAIACLGCGAALWLTSAFLLLRTA